MYVDMDVDVSSHLYSQGHPYGQASHRSQNICITMSPSCHHQPGVGLHDTAQTVPFTHTKAIPLMLNTPQIVTYFLFDNH